jgi:hypothetical protein
MREYLLAVAAGLAIGGAWEVGGGTTSAFFAAPAPAPPAPFKQPTATEYWRLQGECVKLAENILNGFGGACATFWPSKASWMRRDSRLLKIKS